MNVEFTGERVVPGQVDENLWNEHRARYAFAAQFAEGRRVLDAGCGAGYGSAELAAVARSVTGMDVAQDAVGFGSSAYSAAGVRWVRGSCAALPFASRSFDLVVAFEVIEHLRDWASLVAEARRVLTQGGQFLVSTPNKSFYAKTRELEGPNPYHEHEFEFGEFRDALSEFFPHVAFFVQDHVEGELFRGAESAAGVRIEHRDADLEDAGFYVAVCSLEPQQGRPSFVYIPKAANVLREKLLHIERLEGEVATKTAWLEEAHARHAQLVEQHRAQTAELESRNKWAAELDAELKATLERVAALQDELAAEQKAAGEAIGRLERELAQQTEWGIETERRLTAQLQEIAADRDRQTADLVKCVEVLHETEAQLEERSRWAMHVEEQRQRLEAMLHAAEASRWLRLGRAVGIGPELKIR